MEKRLLTTEEINLIIKESSDSKYQIDNLFHLSGIHTTIQRVSKKTGLILIKGNDATGFDHIMVRHSPTSKSGHWIKGEKIKLDDPSRFSLSTIPIFDYLAIADDVYKSENIVSDKRNKEPETFDLFIGKYTDRKGRSMDYKLLLYKGTPIIHNIIPHKKTFNKKKVLDLRQGSIISTLNDMKGIHSYYIPYYDHLDIERAKIIIRLQTHIGQENWNIQINDKDGRPLFTHMTDTRKVEKYLQLPFRHINLDYQEDLSGIEKIIKRLMDEIE
jgi:hypothetical protein